MAKYSVIIPVYNASSYLNKCLDSILKQNGDYEIIIVNDGSMDDSEKVIKKYKDSRIKYYIKENGGVSDARNYGISKATGQYFLFVDADDYVSNNLFNVIDNQLSNDIDILSFNLFFVDNCDKVTYESKKPAFSNLSGEQAIVRSIEKSELFDTPVAYVYKTSYFKEHNFKYAVGRVHEDFGLTPLTIIKANNIKSINDSLYYYVQNNTGITGNVTSAMLIKKAWDMLYHFDYLYINVNNDISISSKTKRIFNSFIANAIINKATSLSGSDLKGYIQELKNRHVSSLLLNDSISHELKRLLIKLDLNLYLKLFVKKENKND